jgi:hypothetical protein
MIPIRHRIMIVAALMILAICTASPVSARQPVRVESVRFEEYQPGWIAIYYNLEADPGEYTVEVSFHASDGSGRTIKPSRVGQNIGPGITPGRGKRILWHVQSDFPEGLTEGQYVCQVSASQPRKIWPWLVGGGVAVVGGTAAALIIHHQNEPTTGTLTISLPDHP